MSDDQSDRFFGVSLHDLAPAADQLAPSIPVELVDSIAATLADFPNELHANALQLSGEIIEQIQNDLPAGMHALAMGLAAAAIRLALQRFGRGRPRRITGPVRGPTRPSGGSAPA